MDCVYSFGHHEAVYVRTRLGGPFPHENPGRTLVKSIRFAPPQRPVIRLKPRFRRHRILHANLEGGRIFYISWTVNFTYVDLCGWIRLVRSYFHILIISTVNLMGI